MHTKLPLTMFVVIILLPEFQIHECGSDDEITLYKELNYITRFVCFLFSLFIYLFVFSLYFHYVGFNHCSLFDYILTFYFTEFATV